jgi:hypothetical protein
LLAAFIMVSFNALVNRPEGKFSMEGNYHYLSAETSEYGLAGLSCLQNSKPVTKCKDC